MTRKQYKTFKRLDIIEPNSSFDDFISHPETPCFSYEQRYLHDFACFCIWFNTFAFNRSKKRFTKKRFSKV